MPFLNTIVDFINSSLSNGVLSGITPLQTNGIATVLARKKPDQPLEQMPALVTLDGEYTLVEPKDTFTFINYHKVISNQYSYVKAASYGDAYNVKSVTDMMMIVFSDTKQIQLTVENLEALLILGLPMQFKSANFSSCLIIPVSSNMDKISVFRQEYPQSQFFLKPTNLLFAIRYRIEATFDPACILG